METIQSIFSKSVLVVFILLFGVPETAVSETSKPLEQVSRVLILLSYHETHSWTAGILDGVKDELDSVGRNIELHVEFMDTKRHHIDVMFPQLEELYRTKYKDTLFDLIILADNNALDFLLPRRALLFPDVPIVFCGINNFTPDLIQGVDQITGVAEASDFSGTVELALTLQPETRHIAIVCDHTPTGMAQIQEIQKIYPKFDGRLEFIELFNRTEEELKDALQDLPEKSIVFLLSFYHGRDEKKFTIEEQAKLITENVHVPVYTAWDISIGFGIVGGVMTNGHSQGNQAAKLGVRILDGDLPAQIPVVEKSPNIPTMDYRVMEQFGLSFEKLPVSTIYINKPVSFYTDHTRVIWITLFIFLLQGLLIVYLVINIRQRKQAEQRLNEQGEQLQIIVEERTAELSASNRDLAQEVDNRNKALKQERNLTHILDKSLNEIYLIDADSYKFVFVNEEARINMGYSQAEFFEMTPVDIKPNIDLASFDTIVAPLKSGEKDKVVFETIHKRNDGSTYPVEVHLKKTAYHSRPVLVALIVDITEKKKMEEQIFVNEKLATIAGLAAGVAHEINTPLSAILQAHELVSTGLSPRDTNSKNMAAECNVDLVAVQEYFKKNELDYFLNGIRDSASKARNIIKSLLAFSRPHEGNFSTVHLLEIMDNSLLLSQADYEMKKSYNIMNVHFVTEYAIDSPAITCVPTEIEQVLLNLIKNAVQAMNAADMAKPCITLRTTAGVNSVVIEVEDNGPGILEKNLKRVFDPFFTTKEVGDGTGLGLSVSHAIIVDKHKGSIRVESEPGLRTIFTVELPLTQENHNIIQGQKSNE